jgi:hypothetical protein
MLLAIVPGQRGLDRLDRRVTADLPICGQDLGTTLSRDNRADDLHSPRARDVRNNVMELKIHLHESILHVLVWAAAYWINRSRWCR